MSMLSHLDSLVYWFSFHNIENTVSHREEILDCLAYLPYLVNYPSAALDNIKRKAAGTIGN